MKLARLGYYADWLLIPILACVAVVSDVSYHGVTAAMVLAFAAGVVLWTYTEYAAHRYLAHRTFRREHWFHHLRPQADAMAGWQPCLIALFVFGLFVKGFGMEWGAALFAGVAVGYVTYSIAHDRFHHSFIGRADPGNYWDRAARRHVLHHTAGIEMNFGVTTSIWDIIFGTYLPVK
jgi:sterol desaturase/sphingolipid hydroxylase (fatty acid hydroxylase superfamily)